MIQLLEVGAQARTVRSTHNNQQSSRAHTVVQIALARKRGARKASRGRSSNIFLVDLAGSERHFSDEVVETKTLREGCAINRSLTNLGLCISTLCANSEPSLAKHRLEDLQSSESYQGHRGSLRHVPYRNSALTWLLRESLGGNSVTAIVACLNQSVKCREESLSTLRFADSAKKLTTKANRNVCGNGPQKGGILREVITSDAQATIAALRAELRSLQSQLRDKSRSQPSLHPAVPASSSICSDCSQLH